MFTGIVEEIGEVISVKSGTKSSVLEIRGNLIFDDLKAGDSVSVNGVCLTATSLKKSVFNVDVMS
ncbi:MAG: riboflavin synthase, partial [Peptostreptococcaceae bacterium]|nr:riboflavin synthase [Peptostreptococcaceae bacterium]